MADFGWVGLTVAAVGATLILTLGSIFGWLRSRIEFVSCPQCAGFWVGAVLALAHGSSWKQAFLFGCVVSVVSLLTEAALHRIVERKS